MGTNEVLNGSDLFVNGSNNHENVSALSNYYAVWLYNEKAFEANKPVMSFLIIMSILGMFGNGSVVYIYSCRFKRNTMNYFILLLGISDVIGAFTLSLEAVDRRFPMYSGNIPALCKIVRFVGNIVNIWSAGILVCIAFDRYYKICYPMRSFTMSKAKKLCAAVVLGGCIGAWPISIFHGPEMVMTKIPGVYGMDCADDDNYKDLLVRPLYFATLLTVNLIIFITMVVMYSLLYKEIWKWKHKNVGEDLNKIKSRSVRSISNVSMDKHIHFSEADEVFTDHSGSVKDYNLSDLHGISLVIPVTHNNVFKQNGVQNSNGEVLVSSKHNSSSLESFDSLSSGDDMDLHDGMEMHQQREHGSQLCLNNSLHRDDDGSQDGMHEGEHLNLTFSSCESDKTENSTKQNGTSHISNGHFQNSHLYVTHLTVRNTPNSSLQSSPRETDTINRTKSTSASEEETSRKRSRSESLVSHFSSISSAFKKTLSCKSNSSMKQRTPKSTASLAHSTFLFAVITVTFILSYLPFFIVELLTTTGTLNMNGDLPLGHKQILRLCNSSFCVNTAINPIIYSILNPAFKRQLKIIFLGDSSPPKRGFRVNEIK
ncbi:uncharacterized protein LOC110445607 [Mizuhopecten yessoensis]|uniref:uncharacterized protein LOC110445607 n=1 Tax=Mizuhopecten yessoensis TaxID=6573 RepID=UPI000B45DA1C|nr:uncharacterized protein LOC110445607 [Mizuhopecten yessoensis]